MYFTLAISAANREAGTALVMAALGTDPRVMPIGDQRVAASHSCSRRRCALAGLDQLAARTSCLEI
jgi:hypothetical protein